MVKNIIQEFFGLKLQNGNGEFTFIKFFDSCSLLVFSTAKSLRVQLLNVQLLNRLRGNKKKDSPSIEKPTQPSRKGTEAPELLQFIKNRDLTGAVSFLKVSLL